MDRAIGAFLVIFFIVALAALFNVARYAFEDEDGIIFDDDHCFSNEDDDTLF